MRTNLIFDLFLLGISTVLGQVILSKELLAVFSGNELVYGLIISSWVLFSAAGAAAAPMITKLSRTGTRQLIILQSVAAVLLPLLIIFCRSAGMIFNAPFGAEHGLSYIIGITFLAVFPLAFVLGIQFVTASRLLFQNWDPNHATTYAYAAECAGSVIAGLLLGFYISEHFNSFSIAGLLAIACAYAVFKLKRKLIPALLLLFGIFLLIFPQIEQSTLSLLVSPYKYLYSRDSIYGKIIVTQDRGGHTFYQNGHMLFSTADNALMEETVHMAMLSVDKPEKVLVLGGAPDKLLSEIQKYSPRLIDCTEIDPNVVIAAEEVSDGVHDIKGTAVINRRLKDARAFINNSVERYDVIIVNAPEPASALVNRLYTVDFFRSAISRLSGKGVLCLRLPSSETYLGKDLLEMNSSVFRSLISAFPYVKRVAATFNYYYASQDKGVMSLDQNILKARFVKSTVRSDHFCTSVIDSFFMPLRQESLEEQVTADPDVRLNTDMTPVSYYYEMLNWTAMLSPVTRAVYETVTSVRASFILVLFLLLCTAIRARSHISKRSKYLALALNMATASFAAMALQICLVYVFQSMHGYIYNAIAFMISFFMAGLAAGSLIHMRFFSHQKNVMRELGSYQMSLFLYVLIIFLIFLGRAYIIPSAFPLLIFIPAVFVGAIYSASLEEFTHMRGTDERSVSVIYASDLMGGCIGGFMTTIFMFPVWGLMKTLVFICLATLISAILVYEK